MKPLHVRLQLSSPALVERVPVAGDSMDDVVVDIVPMQFGNVVGLHDPVTLTPSDKTNGIYHVDAGGFRPGKRSFLRVQFRKRIFSVKEGRFLNSDECTPERAPFLLPARLPAWDSGWDNDYDDNEFFGEGDVRVSTSPQTPLTVNVPLRPFYNIGHRGAPYWFPENTTASFQKSLHLGANGLELDLCLTRDDRIVIFHDARQDTIAVQRRWLEGLPYPVVSPEFTVVDGRMHVVIHRLRNGEYEAAPPRPLRSPYEFDLINLTAAQVRDAFRYRHVDGAEHRIADLEEFLEFASANADQIRFVFFDIKNPGESRGGELDHMKRFGGLLGASLRKYDPLPGKMVVCNVVPDYIDALRMGIRDSGEGRVEFAYDAGGGLFKKNALTVASEKKTTVVSIGAAGRTGDLGDVKDAIRCRDYPQEHPEIKTTVNTVVHWTLNERTQILESFMAGVNGILTDKPDELKKILWDGMKVVF